MVELRDIPETAHLWIQRRRVAYRGLTLGDATRAQRQANTAALNGYLSDAAGGVLELPAGAMIEVDGALSIPGSMRIQGNGAALAYKGALNVSPWIGPSAPGLTIDIEHLTLQGATEAEVTAAGNVTTRAVACTTNTNLNLSNVRYTGWLGSCVVGAVGSNVVLDGCDLQSWHSHGLGGDGARGWVVRNSAFRRIGSGSSLDHHLYINPDTWLFLENCEFLNPEQTVANWAIHYYGSDEEKPYRTPLFRNCLFRRKVFTCEKAYTIIENCDFENTLLQIHNDTLISGGTFKSTSMSERTPAARSVRLVNIKAVDSYLVCQIQNPGGTVFQFINPWLINTEIRNRVWPLNTIEVSGGLWESGELDLNGEGVTAHIGGRLQISNAVTFQMWGGATYTQGDVIYYG